MSGVHRRVLTATATLSCDVRTCDAQWESEPYATGDRFRSEESQVGPALDLGWRVFAGGRTQHTYCPQHGPKAPMRLIHGTALR